MMKTVGQRVISLSSKMASNETFVTTSVEQDLKSLKKNLDCFFLIIMGNMVFFLQAGFALYEMGIVRPKNVVNVAVRNVLNPVISALMYCLTGFALSFSDGNGFWGYHYFGLVGLPDELMAVCFFQYSFAAVASSVPSGVVHERCSTIAFVCYTAWTAAFIYPVATHWVATESGWLHQLGFDDFAFSGVVHAMAGTSCLVAAYITGPRLDRFQTEEGRYKTIPPHSTPQVALGSFVFLLGMIAFNAGSQGSISKPGDGDVIGEATLNTLICAMTGALTGLLYHRFTTRSNLKCWNLPSAINGSFVGMVAICAGCNQFENWSSFVVGILSYLFYRLVQILVDKLKVDDVVDAIAVQIGGGYFGLLSVPLFRENGLLANPCKHTAWGFLINAVGGIVIMLWSSANILIIYIVLRYFNLHRVSPCEERAGLDFSLHKQKAYNFIDEELDLAETPISVAGPASVSSAGTRRTYRRIAKALIFSSNTTWKIED